MPRSSGNPFAIGSVSRLIVVSVVLPGALAAEPPNNSTDTSADSIAVTKYLRLIPVLPPDRFSCWYRQLPLDQPVGECACDRDALLHAAGELPRKMRGEPCQPDGLERLVDEPAALAARQLLVLQR